MEKGVFCIASAINGDKIIGGARAAHRRAAPSGPLPGHGPRHAAAACQQAGRAETILRRGILLQPCVPQGFLPGMATEPLALQ